MLAVIENSVDKIKRSLWIIPFLMALAGLGLAIILNYLDSAFWAANVPYLGDSRGASYEGVRLLFTSVAAAIITAMTTILSITLLIFTVLAGQYGSQVLRVFKIRTFSKVVIGWFAGVYIYIIYHIYTITMNNGHSYVPMLSIILGGIFTVSTIFLLIMYFHFLVGQVQINTVAAEVSSELCKWIRSLDALKEEDNPETKKQYPAKIEMEGESFTVHQSGYVQNINKTKLARLAADNKFSIEVIHRPGDFIVTEEVTSIVYADRKMPEELVSEITSCWIVGDKRITVEDLEYNLEILSEMILRALSPSSNDIVIANICIDYLGESIALLVNKRFADTHVYGDDGRLLVVSKEFSFRGYMDSVLNPIRQYSSNHCSVSIRLMDKLLVASKINSCKAYQEIINCHFLAIYESLMKRHNHKIDRDSINHRYQAFLAITAKKALLHN